MPYKYNTVVRGFIEKHRLDEEKFSSAVEISVKMETIDHQIKKLMFSEHRRKNEIERHKLSDEWHSLGKELVKHFTESPDFQESLDAFRWTNGHSWAIKRAIDCTLKIKDVYGSEKEPEFWS
jgi:hypothetical protein